MDLQNTTNAITETTTLPDVASTMHPIPKLVTYFSWYDYIFFCAMLSFSLGIGIYFGCCGKKQTTKEYLLAGGNMKVIPVVISLVSSHCSGVTLLALPAEVYMHGAGYWLCVICFVVVAFTTVFVFLPVFYKLQLTSTYEYLGIRFDQRIRKFSSFLFTISVFLHIPIVTYIPAMAFSSATGLNKNLIIPIVCGICIFYTSIGGLKALVWSDTILFSCTMGGLVTILGLGLSKVGGITNVFKAAYEGDRMISFNLGIDFIERDGFWTVVIGFSVYWIAMMSINQGCTQKFLAVSTLKESKWVVWVYCCFGMTTVKTLGVITGLCMYAYYAKCDPIKSHKVSHSNEMLPFYVLDVAEKIPGLSGLFIAGVFCASLSALSANLNSLAGTVYEDFVKPNLSQEGRKNSGMYLKSFVVLFGIICAALVYTVEYLGGLVALSIGLNSVAQAPLLGLFTLGMLFPRANSTGAFIGGLTSLITMVVLVFGAKYLRSFHVLETPHKVTSIEGCLNQTVSSILLNTTQSTPVPPVNEVVISPLLKLFSMSFYWYCILGTIICVVVGLIVSSLTEENNPPVAKELLSPIIYKFINKDKYIDRLDLDYSGIEDAVNDGDATKRRSSRREISTEEKLRKMSMISVIDS